jgi:hypothetical protein
VWQAVFVNDGRLFVLRGGKVYHEELGSKKGTAGIVGPDSWPLVDASVQAALATTDVRLGIAQFVTVRQLSQVTLGPKES